MIEIVPSGNDALIEVKVIEEATKADINKFKPVLLNHIKEIDNPRLLLIFEEMDAWSEVVALWSDLDLDRDHVNELKRIALVGDPSWKGWLTNMIERMVQTDLTFFGLPDLPKARTWVQTD